MRSGKARPFENLVGDPLRAALRTWADGTGRREGQTDDRLKALLAPGGGEKAGGLDDAGAQRIAEIGGFDAVERRQKASVAREVADHDLRAHLFQNVGALVEGAHKRANATSALDETLGDGSTAAALSAGSRGDENWRCFRIRRHLFVLLSRR
jgi:hypothetical protein